MPDDQPFTISIAASTIATFARDGGFEAVYMVGHSTGAAIAMETAKALRRVRHGMRVHVAGVSTALPAPQPFLAGLRTARGTAGSIFRTGSLRPRTVWLDYYRRISYGEDPSVHAEALAYQLARRRARVITIPSPALATRHFAAILGWQNPEPDHLDGVDLAFWHGAVDPVFPPAPVARFVKTLPKADLHVLETHGHVVHLTYLPLWDDMAARWGFD
jgi:pimeloyl-ACP methyl ester carboxylesterase